MMDTYAPRLADKMMESNFIEGQKSDQPADTNRFEGLYGSSDSRLSERGDYDGHVAESSLYTTASLHPVVTGAAALAAGAGLVYSLYKRNQTH